MATDWIVVNYAKTPVVQECQRCGETAPMPTNCSLKYAGDVMKVFIRNHKKCKEKKAP